MPPHKNKDQDDLAVDVDLCAALFRCGHALDEESSALNCETSFSAMLHKMIEQSDWVSRAQDGARLATDEWWQSVKPSQFSQSMPASPRFITSTNLHSPRANSSGLFARVLHLRSQRPLDAIA